MFQFPSLPSAPYVFRYGHQRITSGRFPHSEIPGSKVGQHLTRAYRSRPRPSSALGAKASTVCPYSLDREELTTNYYGVFKVRADPRPLMRRLRPAAGLSKLNSERIVEVDVDLGDTLRVLGCLTASRPRARGLR